MSICFHALQNFLRSHDLKEVAKSLGYGSLKKGVESLQALLKANSLKEYLGRGHYDFKYDTHSLFLALVKLAGLDEQACASEFEEASAELTKEHAAPQPYIEAIPENKNRDFCNNTIKTFARLALIRNLDKQVIYHAADGQWQSLVQRAVRDFMDETQGSSPLWGKIEGFVYHHTNGEAYRLDTDGNFLDKAEAGDKGK